MMKKNLLLLSDCLKSPVKVQYSIINSKYFLTFVINKSKKNSDQKVACNLYRISMPHNEVMTGLEQKKNSFLIKEKSFCSSEDGN